LEVHRSSGATVHTQRVASANHDGVSRLNNKKVEINHFIVCRNAKEEDRGE
jgi:hypothetical protein